MHQIGPIKAVQEIQGVLDLRDIPALGKIQLR